MAELQESSSECYESVDIEQDFHAVFGSESEFSVDSYSDQNEAVTPPAPPPTPPFLYPLCVHFFPISGVGSDDLEHDGYDGDTESQLSDYRPNYSG